MVYTSTYNAVFYGEPLCGVVDAPYVPDAKFADHYSRTKSHAERLVLAANEPAMRTCAIRAAGIYGDGEERHFPRVVRACACVFPRGVRVADSRRSSDRADRAWLGGLHHRRPRLPSGVGLRRQLGSRTRAGRAAPRRCRLARGRAGVLCLGPAPCQQL